jgi:hypothetical protein
MIQKKITMKVRNGFNAGTVSMVVQNLFFFIVGNIKKIDNVFPGLRQIFLLTF